ncbi:hypothetical protein B0J15DRAFT_496706, partial [Fusarium solani]
MLPLACRLGCTILCETAVDADETGAACKIAEQVSEACQMQLHERPELEIWESVSEISIKRRKAHLCVSAKYF